MTNLTLDEKKALIRMALEAREQAYVPSPAAMWKTLLSPPPAALSARPCSRR